MKKYFFIILFVGAVLITACTFNENNNNGKEENSSKDQTTVQITTEVMTAMSESEIQTAVQNTTEVTTEMGDSETIAIETNPFVDISSLKTMQDIRTFNMKQYENSGYIFFTANDKWYVVQSESDGVNIACIEEYQPFEVTVKDFGDLKEGMNVFQLVEKVGLPVGSATFGMTTMIFEAHDGSQVVVYFDVKDMTANYYVFIYVDKAITPIDNITE